jgi:hypothetical protein
MQKLNAFCRFIPLIFPLLFIACSKHIHYDSVTFREYENFDPQSLNVVIIPDAQNINIEYNIDSSMVIEYNIESSRAKEFEGLFRRNIKKYLSTFLSKYSTLDDVHWGELKSGQELATWEFEIQEMKLHFNLPTDTNKIKFKNHDADIVLIIGKIEINYLTYKSKGHKPNVRDFYHESWSDYYFDISYLYWDNQKGHVISFGKRLFYRTAKLLAAGGKKMISNLAIKLLYATPFQGEWETGSLLKYENL